MKCLLVDDEPGIREGLATLLRRKGHAVQTASDCAAARAALLAQSFDIVITDWRLPDGFALTFAACSPCPVVVVSGHPEEVELVPPMCEVMSKPVTAVRLIAAIEAHAVVRAADADRALPIDVQEVIDDLLAQLPASTPVRLIDDGTFVCVTAELPWEHGIELQPRGGDARWVRGEHGRRFELRLCRDGRPDASLPVVPPLQPWPELAEVAVDFHDTDITVGQLQMCLDRARLAKAAGRRVHFLNVPDRLRSSVAVWGRAHDMPMQAKVGPRLSAELADLWSQP